MLLLLLFVPSVRIEIGEDLIISKGFIILNSFRDHVTHLFKLPIARSRRILLLLRIPKAQRLLLLPAATDLLPRPITTRLLLPIARRSPRVHHMVTKCLSSRGRLLRVDVLARGRRVLLVPVLGRAVPRGPLLRAAERGGGAVDLLVDALGFQLVAVLEVLGGAYY